MLHTVLDVSTYINSFETSAEHDHTHSHIFLSETAVHSGGQGSTTHIYCTFASLSIQANEGA